MPPKTLIIKLSSLGDIAHTLPAVRSISQKFGRENISWLTDEQYKELIRSSMLVEEVISLKGKRAWEILKALKSLRKKRYDLVIDFQGLFLTGAISFLSGGRKRVVTPYAREFSWIFAKRIDGNGRKHAVERTKAVVEYLGASREWEERKFDFSFTEETSSFVEKFLSLSKIAGDLIVGFAVGSRVIQKRWGEWNYARLISKLKNFKVIVFGSEEERGIVKKIKSYGAENFIDAVGKTTLYEALALIKKCHLFLGNDTGLLHLAAIQGIPTIGLYGPTDPALVGPYGERVYTIFKKINCSPCNKTRPRCKRNACMEEIEVKEVYEVIKGWFGK
jgi:ADP-heptose:LPS heptosyltransferase